MKKKHPWRIWTPQIKRDKSLEDLANFRAEPIINTRRKNGLSSLQSANG